MYGHCHNNHPSPKGQRHDICVVCMFIILSIESSGYEVLANWDIRYTGQDATLFENTTPCGVTHSERQYAIEVSRLDLYIEDRFIQ